MRTLIVGSGFVGRALGRRLIEDGDEAVLASRRPPEGLGSDARAPAWTPLDVTDPYACGRTVEQTRPDTVVLVHGPSDVTWCEEHPAEALAGHATATRHMAAASAGRRVVLISTDNVFDGVAPAPDESVPVHPLNAYGRAKLAAEQVLAGRPDSVVLRVSLIYGWEPEGSGKWLNFFAACAHRLRRSQAVAVPYDQWTTPVLLDDVTAVTAAVTRAPHPPPLLHLGGPDRVSRADWAAVIADGLGAPPDLVVPEARKNGRYANRPENSCLSSTLLAGHPSTAGVQVRGVRAGTRLLVERHRPGLRGPDPSEEGA
jgi:dTDP-4-dehydrorhamnose reductase